MMNAPRILQAAKYFSALWQMRKVGKGAKSRPTIRADKKYGK